MFGKLLSLSGLPFDDIRDLISKLHDPDERALKQTQIRNLDIANRFGGLKKHSALTEWLAAYSGKSPVVSRPMIALFAGTHGIVDNISMDIGEPTLDTVTRLAAGGAPVNQVCAVNDIGLKVFDLALQYPVEDITSNDALDEKGAAATIGFGMEAIAGGVDVLGLAAFGQGSEIANTVLLSLLLNVDSKSFAEDLYGISDEMTGLVMSAFDRHKSTLNDPLELLRRLGGREHSAIAGAILAARINHIPVVLEGWSAIAVVKLLQALEKTSCDHCCFASLGTGTIGPYDKAIESTGLQSVLADFEILSDGSNAAQAIGVLKAAASIHSGTVFEA